MRSKFLYTTNHLLIREQIQLANPYIAKANRIAVVLQFDRTLATHFIVVGDPLEGGSKNSIDPQIS